MTKRILIVGGVAAGPSAASKAARTNPQAQIILFEQGEHVSYGICEIPYYIGDEFSESGLIAYTPERLKEEKRVDVRIHHIVEEINSAQRTILVRDLGTGTVRAEPYDRLIIATGSRAKRLGINGEDARNVFTVKSLDDGLRSKDFINSERPKKAVIIGGGYIGMEMSEALVKVGLDVTLLHLHDLPMAGLERETRERAKAALEGAGVTFMGHTITEGLIVDKQNKVTHIVTSTGSYEADMVVLSLGVQPNSELAQGAGVHVGRYGGILTDQRQQTNIDNIFAAGDCCEVKNIVNNQSMYIPLATSASKMGWTAGENAAGGKATFRGVVRSIAVKIFDLHVAQVGISSAEAAKSGFDVVTESITAWSKVAGMPESKKLWICMIADRKSRRILGANLCGGEGTVLRANTLAVGIQQRITVDEMQRWDLAYSPPFTPLWDPILVAANAMVKTLGSFHTNPR